MKILIAGGCFTHQHNIPFERLYHQYMRYLLIEKTHQEVEIQTLNYERVTKTLEKIQIRHAEFPFHLLIFHLRIEPALRTIKFLYRYKARTGKTRFALNLPNLRFNKAERFGFKGDLANNQNPDQEANSIWRNLLRRLNNHLGCLAGNKRFCRHLYASFIEELSDYCKKQNAGFLLSGPASNPGNYFGNRLSQEFNEYFSAFAEKRKIPYLALTGERTSKGANMFFPNGLHVSQEGHEEIGKKLFEKIISTLQNVAVSSQQSTVSSESPFSN